MSELKITIDQLKNYLGTGLRMKVKHKTIGQQPVINPFFSLDSINTAFQRASVWTYEEKFLNQFGICGKGFQSNEYQLICYRLSDLDKFISELGFVPIKELNNTITMGEYELKILKSVSWDYYFLPNWIIEKLFQWHFWPFGDEYFEAGLVIDKLKLNEK